MAEVMSEAARKLAIAMMVLEAVEDVADQCVMG